VQRIKSILSALRKTCEIFASTYGHKIRRYPGVLIIVLTWAFFPFCPSTAHSAQVSLAWEQGLGPAPAGYAIFLRQEGQSYDFTDPAWEGPETSCTISDLDDSTTYFFVARAFDLDGNQSDNSNEVCYEPQDQKLPDSDNSDDATQEDSSPSDPVETGNDAPATRGGGGVRPLPPTPDESPIVSPETPVGSVVDVEAGATIDNTGKTLSGDITLGQGARIDGGTVTGTVTGQGEGATITNAVIDLMSVSGVTLGSGCKVTQATVNANPGMDLTGVISGPDGLVDPNAVLLLDETVGELTVRALIGELVKDALQDETVSIQVDGDGTLVIFAQALGGVIVPAKVESVATCSWPDGIEVSRTGELVMKKDRVVITMAPAWLDPVSLAGALETLGFEQHSAENGFAVIQVAGNKSVALRPDITARMPHDPGGHFRSLSTPVRLEGDLNDPDNSHFSITYPDGTVQRILPFVYDLERFREFMEANGVNYLLDSSTGLISLLDSNDLPVWRGMPSYTILNPPAGATEIAFKPAGDLNKDGLPDIYVITDKAKQAIYTLP
jgi:hypothetical protein